MGRDAGYVRRALKKGLTLHIRFEAVEEEALTSFKDNGTLPATVTDPSHRDNLFPLCSSCHRAYDAGSLPSWILIPDVPTLEKYIRHEKENYDHRYLISRATTVPPPESLLRTLPVIDSLRSSVFYWFNSLRWPKVWLGEPTTVIHRVARRGLLESTPVRPISLGKGRGWQRGVSAVFQVLVRELFRLWARPSPVKGQE